MTTIQLSATHPTTEQRLTMSYAEFLAWSVEERHAEWVNGEVIVFAPPKNRHQSVVGFLHILISLFANLFDLGVTRVAPFEMRAQPNGSAREPDLLFIAREHQDRLTEDRLEGPADLIVEVVSLSSVARGRADKFYEYQEAGIPEYWIIDPRPGKERADFYALTSERKYQAILPDADDRYHSTVLSGFWLRLDWLWQEPTPDPLRAIARIAPQALHTLLDEAQGDSAG